MRKRLKKAAGFFFLWAGGLLLLNILMAAGLYLFPQEKLSHHILSTGRYLEEKEELFYMEKEGRYHRAIDNYADAILFNILYEMDRAKPVRSILATAYYRGEEATPLGALSIAVEKGKEANVIYDRYWHGMMLYLRPLFLFTDIRGIRAVSAALLLTGGALLLFRLWKRGDGALCVWLIIAFLAVSGDMAARCMEYFSVFFVTLLMSHLLLCFLDAHRERIAPLFLAGGLLCAYFDFLTTETLVFVIPFVICFYDFWRRGLLKGWKEEWRRFIGYGLLWAAGYMATFLSKWLLSTACFQTDRFQAAFHQAMFRVNGRETAGHQILSALYRNISCLAGIYEIESGAAQAAAVFLPLIAGLCFGFLFHRKKDQCFPAAVLFAAGLLPLLRIIALNSHSARHFFFTYRALAGTIAAWGAALTVLTDRSLLSGLFDESRKKIREKRPAVKRE